MLRLIALVILIAGEAYACPININVTGGTFNIGCPASLFVPTATPTPAPPTPTPTPNGVFTAALADWESNMTTVGATWCSRTGQSEDEAWYYDGLAVYQKIRDYTADAVTWQPCVDNYETVYTGIINAAGSLAGRRAFAEGLRLNGNNAELQELMNGVTYSNLFHNCSDPDSAHTIVPTREIAYHLETQIENSIAGYSSPFTIEDISTSDQCTNQGNSHTIDEDDSLQFVEWHLDQFVSGTVEDGWVNIQPFMVALSANAAIHYWEKISQKASIKTKVKAAADFLWTNTWDATNGRFQYCWTRPSGAICLDPSDNDYAHDLNLLIAPMYAWLYHEGEGTVYRDRFDTIFREGVTRADISFRGKTFSQNYREMFDAIIWRQAGPV